MQVSVSVPVSVNIKMKSIYLCMCRVGQNHIYTVYIRYFWQGNHQIYGHIQCIYTVLANPMHVCLLFVCLCVCVCVCVCV